MLAAISREITAPIVTTSGRSPRRAVRAPPRAFVAELRPGDAARLGFGGQVHDLVPPAPGLGRRVAASARSPPAPPAGGRRRCAPCACAGRRACGRGCSSPRLDQVGSRARPQLGGGGLGVGRVADRPDDDDAARPGRDDLGDVAGVDAADREPGQVGLGGGRADVVEARRGPARLRRRRPDGPDADVVGAGLAGGSWAARSCSGSWVERPTTASGPARRRASATGMSSWPTWTPSAGRRRRGRDGR